MPRPSTRVLLATALLASLGPGVPQAGAQDLFSVTVTGGGNTVTDTDSNLLDLLEDAIQTQGAFNGLVGTGFTAVARYADIENAIVVSLNASETEATLTFPGTGFSQTFVGSDADDLEDEIERFIEEDGGSAFAAFLADLNERSVVSVLDGNPFSTTALANEQLFDTWGLGGSGPRLNAAPVRGYGGEPAVDDPFDGGYVVSDYEGPPVARSVDRDTGTYREDHQTAWFAFTPRVSVLEADGFDGVASSFNLSAGVWFADWVGLSIGGNTSVVDYEETFIVHSSFNLAVPFRPVNTIDQDGFGVALGLTPFVLTGVGGSRDAANGGAFYGYGGALNLTLGLGSVQFTGAAQYIDFQDQDLDFDEFEFDTQLDQSAVTVGGSLRVFLDGPNGHWFIDGGLTYVEYLEAAAVSDWLRPEAGLGYRWGSDNRVRLSYRDLIAETSDGRDFDAYSIGVNVVVGF